MFVVDMRFVVCVVVVNVLVVLLLMLSVGNVIVVEFRMLCRKLMWVILFLVILWVYCWMMGLVKVIV